MQNRSPCLGFFEKGCITSVGRSDDFYVLFLLKQNINIKLYLIFEYYSAKNVLEYLGELKSAL